LYNKSQILNTVCFNQTQNHGCKKCSYSEKQTNVSGFFSLLPKYLSLFFLVICFTTLQFFVVAQNYDAELLFCKTKIEVAKDKLTKDYLFQIKINNRAGEDYTTIKIPYSNLNKIRNIEAFITDNNNRIVKKLSKNEIVEKSAITDFSFYEDNMIKEFTLKHNTYPYTITYSFQSQQSEFLFIDYWIPVIDEKIPTNKAELEIIVPYNYEIAHSSNNISAPSIDSLENGICYKWNSNFTKPIKPEIFSPPLSLFFPKVVVTPKLFRYDITGSLESWITFGNWQNDLLSGLDILPDDEKNKILSLTKNVTDQKEKIRILYHYLQNETRYVNISIETGGLKPYPAFDVAQNKYGDCKALTNYMKSVLAVVGIKSYYTKIKAGSTIYPINKDLPSQQFDHIILYVPLKNEDIWLDCTSDGAFNYLGTFTQNRDAFVIVNNQSHFLNTPKMTLSEVRELRTVKFKNDIHGIISEFNCKYYGDMYENFIMLNNSFNNSEKSRFLRNNFVENGFELIDYKFPEPGRDSTFIEFNYTASAKNIYNLYGNNLIISVIPLSIPSFIKPEDRKLPLQIDFPLCKIDSLIFDIPEGFIMNNKIPEYTISSKYGEFSVKINEEPKKIIIIKSFTIYSGSYQLSEYNDYYSFYTQIIRKDKKMQIALIKN
jgi:hypothetical protein